MQKDEIVRTDLVDNFSFVVFLADFIDSAD